MTLTVASLKFLLWLFYDPKMLAKKQQEEINLICCWKMNLRCLAIKMKFHPHVSNFELGPSLNDILMCSFQ
jgi:hypothetical protein